MCEASKSNKDTLIKIENCTPPCREKSRPSWQDHRQQFSWVKYIEHCQKATDHQGKAAPLKLWPEPFPCSKNLFQPGMKLEGIDPQHQSLFCVMTVADVMGHRVKLHFDGYSDVHDFWTNADSPNLFRVGWCEKNNRVLSTVPGTMRFTWKAYLEHCKSNVAAPRHAFATKYMSIATECNNIRPGMKLEAEDRKNGWMCVATVMDIMDNRLLIHYDGWEDAFDFWAEVNSPYIRPVGWCAHNNVKLYPPKDYPHSQNFNWYEYLQETNSVAAPTRSFKTRQPREFKNHMKLEVVDKRNTMLIRVATVIDVNFYQIKIHFDGWDSIYDYWVDDDCPDIHPPSWCNKTGHPLQPPLTPEIILEDKARENSCGIAGCKGYGHVKGPIFTTHHTSFGCPYAPENADKDPDLLIPDRVILESDKKPRKFSSRAVLLDLGTGSLDEDNLKKRVRKRRRFFDEICAPESKSKCPKLANDDVKLFSDCTVSLTNISRTSSQDKGQNKQGNAEPSIDAQVHQSVFCSSYAYVPVALPTDNWKHLRHLFTPLGDVDRDLVRTWTPQQVG